MSFASTTKDELALSAKAHGRAEKLALLCALTHTAGSMVLWRGGLIAQYVTENSNVARLTASTAKELYDVSASISVSEKEGLRSVSNIVRLSGDGVRRLLEDAGCLPSGELELELGRIPPGLIVRENEVKCFLRGAFLGAGSVSDPSKGYHLEIVCRYEPFAMELSGMLLKRGVNAKYALRKGNFIVYMKEGEAVSDFLTLVGAMNSRLAFEDARMLRGLSNELNRRQNFEDANMNKSAAAAAQQLLDLEVIRANLGLDRLPRRLREAAELRLNNPEATLSELAQMSEISRSGLNHRLRRIGEIAEELRGERGAVPGPPDEKEL